MNPRVHFKKIHPDALTPQYHTSGAAGFDLACIEDIQVTSGDPPKLFRTGLAIAAPEDHFLYIVERSSSPRKHKIRVVPGIVDEDYSGDEDELHLQIYAVPMGAPYIRTMTISAGTRVAQGIFIPVTQGRFVRVGKMGASRGGFGSTG